MKRPTVAALVAWCLWLSPEVAPTRLLAQAPSRPPGWTESSHGSRAAPDYRRLFGMDTVHELRITIAPDDFARMQADLKAIAPGFGPGGPMPGFGPGGPRAGGPPGAAPGPGGAPPFAALMEAAGAACSEKKEGSACTANGMDGQCNAMVGGPLMCVPKAFADLMPAGGPPVSLTTRDPIYVPVTVRHDGRTWRSVGMRFKGNSSLMASSVGGNGKVPFRLDFDRYEDTVRGVANQRFYGFQELTFSSNFSDDSQLREVLASEMFRDRGVPAPRAAFYRIFVDTGAGDEYWGLYAMVEDPSDGAMLDSQFGSRKGNLYKPDGPGADWTRFAREGFPKKTNEDEADFSDIEAAIRALHAPRDDAAAWRTGVEATFDVAGFLRWLAVNTVIDNWDVYGAMPHNYYLYGDPAQKGRLRWIPWDNNMAFGVGMGFGPPGAGPARMGGPPPLPPGAGLPPGGRARGPGGFPFGAGGDVLHRQVSDRWPLIQFLLADPVYAGRYREFLSDALEGLAAPAAFEQRAKALHRLIAPSVVGPQGERPGHTTVSSPAAFEGSVDGPGGLVEKMRTRREQVRTALGGASRP